MKKAQRQEILDMIATVNEAHDEIKNNIQRGNIEGAQGMLAQCQECAITIGTAIEKFEGEGFVTIPYVEEYCDTVFSIYEELGTPGTSVNANNIYKRLRKQLLRIDNSVRNDIPLKKEIVFFPYKASMWDSLESIYLAAKNDPECDAYCVPIPYFDMNADGAEGKMHYEGNDYPDYIEITDWKKYDLEKRRPDVAYIHNPYDDTNLVTRVHSRYFSYNLKRYVEELVYVPYFSTTGGMSDSQELCSAYVHADHIVIQSKKMRKFYDPRLPAKKFLPFGSPKFDRVVRFCNNPPEPPAEWKARMEGKKVYFFNTSIGGLLGQTDKFLKKMEYVFDCFEGRQDACLFWRPHPLFESTIESMRPGYKAEYERIKNRFFESNLGIYDTTPDITNAIALCDAFIGDQGTSVTSLFGIAGKPLFILDNVIDCAPNEEDWRGQVVRELFPLPRAGSQWMITLGNKLFYSENNDYSFKYSADLSDYTGGGYYGRVIGQDEYYPTCNGLYYVCPRNAQDFLIIKDGRIEKRVELKREIEQAGVFRGEGITDKYLILIPNRYPAVVRYDLKTGEIRYMGKHLDICAAQIEGERRLGPVFIEPEWRYAYFADPMCKQVLKLDIETSKEEMLNINSRNECGSLGWAYDGEDLWILPYNGFVITRWNPKTGAVKEYSNFPDGLSCIDPRYNMPCEKTPFGSCAFYGDDIYFAPYWGNMFVKLNKTTGSITEWKPFWDAPKERKSCYYPEFPKATFMAADPDITHIPPHKYWVSSPLERKLYDIDFETETFKEIPITFDKDELHANAQGFGADSEWLQYSCAENVFNSLPDFLDGNISGNQFDREEQLRRYWSNAENPDGTCGEKVHNFTKNL